MRQIEFICILLLLGMTAFGQESILNLKEKIETQLKDTFEVELDGDWINIKSKVKVKLANTVSLPHMTTEKRTEYLNQCATESNLNFKLYFNDAKLSEDDYKLLVDLKKKKATSPNINKDVTQRNFVIPVYFNKIYSIYIFKNVSNYNNLYREEDFNLHEKLIKTLDSLFEKY